VCQTPAQNRPKAFHSWARAAKTVAIGPIEVNPLMLPNHWKPQRHSSHDRGCTIHQIRRWLVVRVSFKLALATKISFPRSDRGPCKFFSVRTRHDSTVFAIEVCVPAREWLCLYRYLLFLLRRPAEREDLFANQDIFLVSWTLEVRQRSRNARFNNACHGLPEVGHGSRPTPSRCAVAGDLGTRYRIFVKDLRSSSAQTRDSKSTT
jgi:hypothetical protein